LLLLTISMIVMGTGCKDSAALSNLTEIAACVHVCVCVCSKTMGIEEEAGMREGDRWVASLHKPYSSTKKKTTPKKTKKQSNC